MIVCQYCNKPAKLVNSEIVYGKDYGKLWYCKLCGAYVNVNISGGTLANRTLRILRKQAHDVFDPLWKKKIKKDNCTKREARTLGYIWLSKQLGIEKKECHIGSMDEDLCKKVIEVCEPFSKKKRNG